MTSTLLIVQIVLVIMLVIAVLLQKSSSIGLGAYSGSNESVFGAKGPSGFLAKITFFLGFLFVANTITLGYFYGQSKNASVVDTMIETVDVTAPSADTPSIDIAAPAVPSAVTPSTQTPAPSVPTESNTSH
jgi:preprotein translocase subunit SecG